MAKLFHPTANSFTPADGQEITKAKDGSFDIPEEHVALATGTFGFTDQKPAKE